MHISKSELEKLPSRYRAQLINSISGFKSANLIGTQSKESGSNLAIFNSVIHIGASPALLGFILRPHTVERHTYENILETEEYTLNHVNKQFYKAAHQSAAKYPKQISEFEAVGLNEEYLPDFSAPFVKQSHIKLGMRFEKDLLIDLNETHLIIGSVQHIQLNKEYIQDDGSVNLQQAETVAISGLDSYHSTDLLEKLPYATIEKSNQK